MSEALAEDTASATADRRGWTIFALVGVVIGVLRVESIADPNVLWETRDGLNIVSSGHLPRSDTWSWTVTGKHWVPNSWGWDVVLGAAYRLGSGTGLVVLN